MDRIRLRFLLLAFGLMAPTFGAWAQTPLPIKPGLWEIHTDRDVDGQKQPDMSERMKNMPPEARAQVEAMMKQRGIDPNIAGGVGKVCYSREMVERGRWADEPSDCKTDFTSQSTTSWKWHSVCSKLSYEGDGEATFSNSENYVVKATSVTKIGDKVRTSHSTITGKYLSADCGDLKPLQLKP